MGELVHQFHVREANILAKASEHIIMEVAVKHGGFVAGGAVRSVFASEKISDFDIFFPDKSAFGACCNDLAKECDCDGHFKYNFTKTDSAWSYFTDRKQHFQLICAAFGNIEEILNSFDFTICMGAWIPQTRIGEFVFGEHFMKHIAQRRLCFNVNAEYPIASLWRLMKYTERGYKLPAIEAIKLALKIHDIKINTHEDLKRQLMGIDTIFLSALTDALGNLNVGASYDFGEAIEMIAKFVNEKESENLE